ncbi:MAG: hypothetical protein K2W97_03435 [Chthoniobacterales bacterium]|nr:hypothetical protein [Chthoniobacterales bacterium]
MILKKFPLFLLALFIFGTSRLLLGIPMEGPRQQANPLAGELTQREYVSSEQDERIEDKSGNMESSAFSRGVSPHIAESASNTKSGSADGDPVIELSQLSGVLGSRKVTALADFAASKEQSEKEPLLRSAKGKSIACKF